MTHAPSRLLLDSQALVANWRWLAAQCGPAACVGATENGRPLTLCQSLAKRAGPIDSFMANGHAFTAAELARCNASAKALPAQALASQ